MSRRLIVGLGNPGREYRGTRHNIGFMVVDALAGELGVSFRRQPQVELAEAKWQARDLVLAKPLTFMNLSGVAVSALVQLYGVSWADESLVILDDADLEFGRFRFREKGSAGGHKGLASIIEKAGTSGIHRFRIGIGRPGETEVPLEAYVLEKFSREENERLTDLLKRALDACFLWIARGSLAVMDRYNREV